MVVLSPWVEPFYEGSATATNVPGQYPVAIAGHAYLFEPAGYRRSFIPPQRDPRDDSTEPGEQTLSPEGLWRRSQSDWSLGAGQEWLDEEDSVRRRFSSSLGIDVWGDRIACLLPETEEKQSSGNTNLQLLTVGSRLYVADGAALIFSDGTSSEQNATWVTGWTTATGLPGGSILDVTSSGAHIYVVGSDNSIYRATPGTTSFAGPWLNPVPTITKAWYAVGRLFVSDGALLYHVTGGGAPAVDAAVVYDTSLAGAPLPDNGIVDLVGGPTGIYFAVNVGQNCEVRHFGVDADGLSFTAPVVVAQFLNEQAHALAMASKALVLGTSKGFRFAVVDPDGLEFGPAVTDVGEVRCLTVDTVGAETFFWFGWSNIETGVSGIGRIRPARFTETLVPAYASDIYSAAGGTTLTVASVNGRRYFGISADGFFGPTPTLTLVASATLAIGKVRYGILDAKVFADFEWHTDPIDGEIVATAAFDTGSERSIGAQNAAGTVSAGPYTLGPTPAEWMNVTFTLTRDSGDTTAGPCLRWWLSKAIPAPRTNERILVPLILKNDLALPSGATAKCKPNDELDFLRQLILTQQIVSYQEGASSENVHVTNLEQQPTQWNARDSYLEGLVLVELITI